MLACPLKQFPKMRDVYNAANVDLLMAAKSYTNSIGILDFCLPIRGLKISTGHIFRFCATKEHLKNVGGGSGVDYRSASSVQLN